MDEEKVSSSVLGWIPQVFFDLIGRVVPGIAIIGMSSLLWSGPLQAVQRLHDRVAKASFSAWAAWAVASYIVGLILGALASYAFEREWKMSQHVSPLCTMRFFLRIRRLEPGWRSCPLNCICLAF